MADIDLALRQRERVARWSGQSQPVPQPTTALDRHVNRATELVAQDGGTRYVYYDISGLVFIDKRPPPEHVRKFVVVDGREYPRVVSR
jgi:hypothetical protein